MKHECAAEPSMLMVLRHLFLVSFAPEFLPATYLIVLTTYPEKKQRYMEKTID